MSNNMICDRRTAAAAGILGHAVGDALGVPVEFVPRRQLASHPVTDMRGDGSHGQPAGTWSDDTSLTLCLAESLCTAELDFDDLGRRFVRWLRQAEWTAHGSVFDVGNTTREAIARLERGVEPTQSGPQDETSNGNGSLMRILPLSLYLADDEAAFRIKMAMACSRLTHGHPRSQLACAMFVEVAAALVRGTPIDAALATAQQGVGRLIDEQYPDEREAVARLLAPQLGQPAIDDLSGSGYVIHCLESSLWCALHARSYRDGVLQAVNLGDDTDTTGAVTGGLLGLRFGRAAIPSEWIAALARRDDLHGLCDRFQQACERRWEQQR